MMIGHQKDKLLQNYPYKIELHAHTSPASHCSEASPEEVVWLNKALGYDAIVLTNHFLVNNSKEAAISNQLADFHKACQAAEKAGIRILLGVEARFTENANDYLIYGVDEDILGLIFDYLDSGLAAFRKNVCLSRSILVQAHPFRAPCTIADADLLDGIEVFNFHPHHNSNVHLAELYAFEHPNLIQTAGTDFHHNLKGHCGITALRTNILPKDSFELASILRSRDYLLQIHNSIVLP